MTFRQRALSTLCTALMALPGLARAEQALDEQAPEVAPGIEPRRPSGRPRVSLDELSFPEGLPPAYERHFRHELRRAARRADWGAGRGARIEFRVTVEELSIVEQGGVLRVRCTALGRLPKAKRARSHLDYGGDPQKRRELVERVLGIVARGVVTRLAALERARRKAARSKD